MKLYYCLESLDAIIISKSPATADSHQSLDYIPGSTILGAIAAQSYKDFSEKSWDVFHTGQVKYSNAYIAYKQQKIQQCLPTPLSWHVPKGEFLYHDDDGINKNIKNHANSEYERDEKTQEKQCRGGFITSDANVAKVRLSSSTKTAINADTGTVKESQLYTYNYIQAGQQFIGWIEADEETLNEIKPILQSITRIGKSRNTEFGQVRLTTLVDKEGETDTHELTFIPKDQKLTLWLTSDCQIVNNLGFPILAPTLKDLGSDIKAKLMLSHSFINNHSNMLFNRKRQGFDSEQTLITKGSILVYKAEEQVEVEELKKLQQSGIGINQQLGFGNIIINPKWSREVQFDNSKLFSNQQFTIEPSKNLDTTNMDSVLCHWIEEKVEKNRDLAKASEIVNSALTKICGFYRNGRAYNNIHNSYNAGPSKTQWGLLYNLVRYSDQKIGIDHDEFKQIIAIKNTDKHNWDLDWSNKGIKTFSAQFKHVFKKITSKTVQLQLLERLNQYKLETIQGLTDLEKTLEQENDHE